MRLQDILFSQGFGTRRQCVDLVECGSVRIGHNIIDNPNADIPTNHLSFDVRYPIATGGFKPWQTWLYGEKVYVLMNKPSGYEVSQKPMHWPSVYSLLPPPLLLRSKGALQAVGRLDQDTTGLLILSDDGGFIHRLTSPKKAVEKIYRVTLKHPAIPSAVQKLLEGVMLVEEGRPSLSVKASSCQIIDEYTLMLGLTQGKYHQVKRMIAAVGNRVEALHRTQIGGLILPDTLAYGQWIFLSEETNKKIWVR